MKNKRNTGAVRAEKPDMLRYEKRYSGIVAGVDEAGRGPLYGPVVAAAVVLADGFDICGIDDSKKLTPKKRESLFERITRDCFYGIGIAEAEEIDRINILQATKRAASRAVDELQRVLASRGLRVDHLLIDALELPDITIDQTAIIKGDALSASIAAASIVAKVTRDRMLADADRIFPEYGFARHKGYGTAAHYRAIREYGILPDHRRTFLRNLHEHQ